MLSEHFQSIAGNIDEYVTDFMRIYRESEREVNIQRQINEMTAHLTKEKAKRDKLLDLYTDNYISREEFCERNDGINVLISQLEEDIHTLEKKAEETVDYAKEIANIENYFRTMYSPDHQMSKDEVDEMTKAIIDRIDVVPINEKSMKLEVKLKTGLSAEIAYIHANERYVRRSGHICKIINPPDYCPTGWRYII